MVYIGRVITQELYYALCKIHDKYELAQAPHYHVMVVDDEDSTINKSTCFNNNGDCVCKKTKKVPVKQTTKRHSKRKL